MRQRGVWEPQNWHFRSDLSKVDPGPHRKTPMTLSEHLALAREHDLGTPALHARAAESSPSRLGGQPQMRVGTAWPVAEHPMSFLATLDLAQIRHASLEAGVTLDWLPDSGQLLFFYDVESEAWGFDPDDKGWKVEYIPPNVDTFAATAPEGTEVFHEKLIDFHKVTTYSDEGELLNEGHGLSEEEFEDLREALRNYSVDEQPLHQLGGIVHAIQDERMELDCQLASNGINCGTPG